ncbi:hypothetical protein OAL14_07310 [Gammaproteobacteria bacterium]|nr:hypothetical protein [Gammaproteobacteria bacterium]
MNDTHIETVKNEPEATEKLLDFRDHLHELLQQEESEVPISTWWRWL